MIKRKLLVAPQAMTATANPLYTVADGLSAQIMGCTIHNPTAAPITVKINYVNQAGAAVRPMKCCRKHYKKVKAIHALSLSTTR